MAEIVCTIKEFHKYVGPRIRNQIQSITKKEKRKINHICQMCGRQEELQAAHKRETSRKDIIERVIKKYLVDEKQELVKLDLLEVERLILESHIPIKKSFLFLCQECHTKYDSQNTKLQVKMKEINISSSSTISSQGEL